MSKTRTFNGRKYYLLEYRKGIQHPNSLYGAPILRIFPTMYSRQAFIDNYKSTDWNRCNVKTISSQDACKYYRKGDKWRNGTMKLDVISSKWLYYNANTNEWSETPW